MSEGTVQVVAGMYGGWKKPSKAGLAGMSLGTTLGVLAGIGVVMLLFFTAGWLAALIAGTVLLGFVVGVAWVDQDGMTLAARVGERLAWWQAKSTGGGVYRSGPLAPSARGRCRLPGVAAHLELVEVKDAYGDPVGLVVSKAQRTAALVLSCQPGGTAMTDAAEVDQLVAYWGGWLAQLGEETDIEAASVTIETAPDTGARLGQQLRGRLDPDAPPAARQVLLDAIDTYPLGAAEVNGYVTLVFNMAPPGGKARPVDALAGDIMARLPGLAGSLASTGAGVVRALSAQDLCEVIRVAYDPSVAPLIDQAHAAGQVPDLSWEDVGPVAAEATWDSYHHDSAWSRTWVMTQPQKGMVRSNVLARLLAPHAKIDRKRVTLLYKPIEPGRAAQLVDADVEAATGHAINQTRPNARAAVELKHAQRAADQQANGAGMVEFGMLVTATVTDPEARRDAGVAVANLGAGTRVRLRPVYGSQDSAFAAALPLGLVLSKYLVLPGRSR